MIPRSLLEAEARRQLASFTAADLHNEPDPFADEPPVHIDHGGLEDGRNVLRALCGARPNGRDQFVWFDPEDPWEYENDFLAGSLVPKAPRDVPASVTCPRCLRIAERVMKHHVVLEYAQREER
jgi:hypothetical protein